jgi:F0F1-type ATP synthase delta subunit
MIDKKIKQLVNLSYTNDKLDEVKVKKIANKLKYSDLKRYIRYIKDTEKRKSVIVYLSEDIKDKQLELEIKKKFTNKRIIFKVDKSLLAGIKIVDFDNIYDFSLKNKLDNIAYFIKYN